MSKMRFKANHVIQGDRAVKLYNDLDKLLSSHCRDMMETMGRRDAIELMFFVIGTYITNIENGLEVRGLLMECLKTGNFPSTKKPAGGDKHDR